MGRLQTHWPRASGLRALNCLLSLLIIDSSLKLKLLSVATVVVEQRASPVELLQTGQRELDQLKAIMPLGSQVPALPSKATGSKWRVAPEESADGRHATVVAELAELAPMFAAARKMLADALDPRPQASPGWNCTDQSAYHNVDAHVTKSKRGSVSSLGLKVCSPVCTLSSSYLRGLHPTATALPQRPQMPSLHLMLVQAEAAERHQRVWEQLTSAGHAAPAARAGPGPSTAVTGACSGAAGGLSGLACAADGVTELDVLSEVRHASCFMPPARTLL